MLVEATTKRSVGRSANVNDFTTVVQKIDAKLSTEIDRRCSNLLHSEYSWRGTPFDPIAAPEHSEGTHYVILLFGFFGINDLRSQLGRRGRDWRRSQL